MAKKVIMVVEDEDSLRMLESILLTSRGYKVFSVGNGKDALECIEKELVDLILLDIMLPDMDGYEVCRQVKSNPETSHIPVIFMTAKKTEADKAKGQEVKADEYITKPFKSAVVLDTIQNFLNR